MPHHTLMPKSVCINQETDRTFHDKWQLRVVHKWRQKILGRKMSKLRLNLSGPKLKPKFWWEALSGGVREGGVIWSWRKKWRHLWMAPGVLNTLPPRHLSTDRSRKKVFFFFFAFSHKTIIMLPSLHWCSILGCFNILWPHLKNYFYWLKITIVLAALCTVVENFFVDGALSE